MMAEIFFYFFKIILMKEIVFIKMHGLGNDFVIVENSLISEVEDVKNFAITVSNRQIGIGCDQFITYTKHDHFISMNIFNQDGSRAKACGNASRCISRLIFDKYGIKDVTINIDDKKINTVYSDPDNITVNMGIANFSTDWMPTQEKLWQIAEKYRIEPKEMICVDVGNPHLVIFTKLSDKDKKIIGKNLQNHDLFTNGVNVNFAQVEDNTIFLKVWERGTGFTMACGSGASASFAAASKLAFVDKAAIVSFELGSLKMQEQDNQILMTGSASYVFTGEYYL
jgi:diaminopimelate epimerase